MTHYTGEPCAEARARDPSPAPGKASGDGQTPDLLGAALDYARRGWCIIPVRYVRGRKQGAVKWKRFQEHPPDEATLRKWFANGQYPALAVVLGPVSGGLCCRDFDVAHSYAAWADTHPNLAATLPTAQTGRGFHVYFRADVPRTIHLGDGELRGARSMCVLPPSPHPSGGEYRWIVPLPEGKLPRIDPDGADLAGPGMLQRRTEVDGSRQSKLNVGEQGREDVAHALSRHVQTSPDCPHLPLPLPEQILRSCAPEIDLAIAATLPQRPGTRNQQVFRLARALKGIPALAGLPAGAFRSVVRSWHTQARNVSGEHPFEDTWADFIVDWPKVCVPLTADFLEQVLSKAREDPLVGLDYEDPTIRLLAALCRELQGVMGDRPLFLSARTGAKLLGVTPMRVYRWLKVLEADGWLRVAQKGDNNTMRATRFFFHDPRQNDFSEKK